MSQRGHAARAAVLLVALAGCAPRAAEQRELERRKTSLLRELEGLRRMAGMLERGEPVVPENDVAIAIDEAFVAQLLAAQLPLALEVERFHVRLQSAEVQFHGSPVVRLRGELRLREGLDLAGTLSATSAIEEIEIEPASGTLRARLALDAIEIEKASGIASLLGEAALERAARAIRGQLAGLLPPIVIPVRVQQQLDLPAVTTGPVRLAGARLPFQVAISRVQAGRGRLWIGVSVRPGEIVRRAATAEDP